MSEREMTPNVIHPTALIGPDVALGTGNTIGPYAVFMGRCEIGDDNWFGPSVVVGAPAEGRSFSLELDDGMGVRIGNGNVIRELTTVHQGTHRRTAVGDDCYVMARSHVSHDVILSDGVTLSTAVTLGGHTWVGEGANLGLGAVVHQWRCIGPHAMVGMQSAVTKDVLPGALTLGVPAAVKGPNVVGLQRAGLDGAAVTSVERWFERVLKGDAPEPPHALRDHFTAFTTAQAHQEG